MKKFLTAVVIVVSTMTFAQQKFTKTYSALAIIDGRDVGEILNTKATVTFNSETKNVTVKQADNSLDEYSIISKQEYSQTSSGSNYMAVLTKSGKYQFYFTFFDKKLMIINKTTKKGLVLYK